MRLTQQQHTRKIKDLAKAGKDSHGWAVTKGYSSAFTHQQFTEACNEYRANMFALTDALREAESSFPLHNFVGDLCLKD